MDSLHYFLDTFKCLMARGNHTALNPMLALTLLNILYTLGKPEIFSSNSRPGYVNEALPIINYTMINNINININVH
jgi:hypothetical protein